jgi:hypothetical protein
MVGTKLRRMLLTAIVAGLGLTGCGPSVDRDAAALCREVPTARQQVNAIAANVPNTRDFEVISWKLMDLYKATEPLQQWSYVATDALNGPVRQTARAALLHTGGYSDGSNPVTGDELTRNLAAAEARWDELEAACATLRDR